MSAWPKPTAEQLLANLRDRHSVFAHGHSVAICGWLSSHVVRPIAFCETPEYAELLARSLKSLMTGPAAPGASNERSNVAPSQEDGGSAGPGAVDTPNEREIP